MDLLINCIHHSELQVVTTPVLISTIHRSLQYLLSPACCLFNSRSLVTASNSSDSSAFHADIVTVRRIHPHLNCQLNCSAIFLQDNSLARTMQEAQPLHYCRGVFTAPLYSNGRDADHIENTVSLLLRALFCCGRFLESRCLASGLFVTTSCFTVMQFHCKEINLLH
jgi:hypothetical protein